MIVCENCVKFCGWVQGAYAPDIWRSGASAIFSKSRAPLMQLLREEWGATQALNLTAVWMCTAIVR